MPGSKTVAVGAPKKQMSGPEVLAVGGAMSAAIGILEGSADIWETIKATPGLPEAFQRVSENIPLVTDTLRAAEAIQRRAFVTCEQTGDAAERKAIESTSKAIKPLIDTCKTNAESLQTIFQKVVHNGDESRIERYRKAVHTVMPGRRALVEQLMREIIEKLVLLQQNQYFNAVARPTELSHASNALRIVPCSLDDEEFSKFSVNGNGQQYNSTGSTAAMYIQHSHGTMNFGMRAP